MAYTLSKSEQRTPGRTATATNGISPLETGINFGGEWYNTPYDKTHDFSLYGTYELNKKWSFNSNFVFQTGGQPTNYPIGQYEFQRLTVPFYGKRNEERLPAYHRIDLSATMTPRKNAIEIGKANGFLVCTMCTTVEMPLLSILVEM